MGPPRFDHRQMILKIMDEGLVDDVINDILERTKNDPPKKRAAVFANIRTKIMRKRVYTRPEAMTQLRELATNASGPDKTTLEFMCNLPVHNIHWAQSRPSMFQSLDVQAAFREIKFYQPNLYLFDCPMDIKFQVRQGYEQEVQDNHHHKKRPVEEYHFAETEIEAMVTEAEAFICSDQQWTKRISSVKLLDCLSLVSGRRKWELCSTLKVKSVPDRDYQAQVSGIAKRALKDFNHDVWFTIPLLVKIDVFVRGLAQLRQYPHTMGEYHYTDKIFPKMKHTYYRNIFSTWAFKNRETNKFLEGESCSELGFRSKALCIAVNTAGCHYSILSVDTDSNEPDINIASEESLSKRRKVSNHAGQPQEHVCEDSC